MVDELSNPRKILEETDWAGLENRSGSAYPGTPTMLLGLASGDSQAAEAALFHLSHELLEYPNVYSAAVPAARYVAALLDDPRGEDLLMSSWKEGGRSLRANLLAWLSNVVDSVSGDMERKFIELAGYSPMEYPSSTFRKIREIRSQIFSGVAACLDDQDPVVREEAIAAAVIIVQAPELASHREALTPSVRDVLAVSSNPVYRRRAVTALAAWGEDAGFV